MDHDSLKRKAIKAGVGYGAVKLTGQIFSWGITLVVMRLLTTQEYGLIAISALFIELSRFLVQGGLDQTIIRKVNVTDSELNSFFWFSNVIAIALVVLNVFLIAPLVGSFYQDQQLEIILRVLSLVLILEAAKLIPFALLTKRLDVFRRSLCELLGLFISSVTVLTLAFLKFGVWSLVAGAIVSSATICLSTYIVAKWLPTLHFSFRALKEHAKFSFHILMGNYLWFIYANSDIFILSKIVSLSDLGIYSIARRFIGIVFQYGIGIWNQVSTAYLAHYQNDKAFLARIFIKITTTFLPALLAGYILLYIWHDCIFSLVLGDQWKSIGTFLVIIYPSLFFSLLSSVFLSIATIQGRPDINNRYLLACLVFMPLGFFFLGIKFQAVGASYCWTTIYPVLVLFFVLKHLQMINLRIRPFLSAIWSKIRLGLCLLLPIFLLKSAVVPQSCYWVLVLNIGLTLVTCIMLMQVVRPIVKLVSKK